MSIDRIDPRLPEEFEGVLWAIQALWWLESVFREAPVGRAHASSGYKEGEKVVAMP